MKHLPVATYSPRPLPLNNPTSRPLMNSVHQISFIMQGSHYFPSDSLFSLPSRSSVNNTLMTSALLFSPRNPNLRVSL
ncbi:hypothetical protein E2C01_053240 [Portunus trituberculatus]|uniref:Uncharacterized protein n=1 Tax=Portunus trituberculatus TaxID=210409 RepID=A0A5B7GRH1_PORTR|nr:hypothetical protein [Portunus trituberculatus]